MVDDSVTVSLSDLPSNLDLSTESQPSKSATRYCCRSFIIAVFEHALLSGLVLAYFVAVRAVYYNRGQDGGAWFAGFMWIVLLVLFIRRRRRQTHVRHTANPPDCLYLGWWLVFFVATIMAPMSAHFCEMAHQYEEYPMQEYATPFQLSEILAQAPNSVVTMTPQWVNPQLYGTCLVGQDLQALVLSIHTSYDFVFGLMGSPPIAPTDPLPVQGDGTLWMRLPQGKEGSAFFYALRDIRQRFPSANLSANAGVLVADGNYARRALFRWHCTNSLIAFAVLWAFFACLLFVGDVIWHCMHKDEREVFTSGRHH